MPAGNIKLPLNLAIFIFMLGVGMVSSIFPAQIIKLTGTSAGVGAMAAAFGLPYILVQAPLGRWADRIGFKPLILAGYLLASVTGLFYFLSESLPCFLAARVLHGLGEAPLWALAPALLAMRYPDSRGWVIGCYSAWLHLGLTLGPLISLVMLGVWPVQAQFLVFSLLCLMACLVVALGAGQTGPASSSHLKTSAKHGGGLIEFGTNLPVLAGILLTGVCYAVHLTCLPAYLIEQKGFSNTQGGLYFTLYYCCLGGAQLVGGWLCDRLGSHMPMRLGLAISGLGLFLSPLLEAPHIFIPLAAAGAGLGLFGCSSMAMLNQSAAGHRKGEVSGIYYLIWGAGYFAGPLAMDWLFARAGNMAMGTQLLGLCMFGCFAWLILHSRLPDNKPA
jgi:MFS family permease